MQIVSSCLFQVNQRPILTIGFVAVECAKRWHHSVDPSLDHSEWTPEDDSRLVRAVASHGRVWTTIGEIEFPRRSATELKNR